MIRPLTGFVIEPSGPRFYVRAHGRDIALCDTREEAQTVCMDLELAASGRGGCADGAEGLRAAVEQQS